jgi:hypothetical protein
LNEFDLLCYEDDTTNRLRESLDLFEYLVSKLENVSFDIVFTKKDILIENIQKGYDFSNLRNFGFKKEITFENIVKFHIELFFDYFKNDDILKYNFYCTNLIDFDDSKKLFKDVMNQILYNKINNIIYPHIYYYEIKMLNFHFFDIWIYYQ